MSVHVLGPIQTNVNVTIFLYFVCSNIDCSSEMRMYNAIPNEIDTWPRVLQDILHYVGTVSFIFPFAIVLWYVEMSCTLELGVAQCTFQIASDMKLEFCIVQHSVIRG